MCLVGGNNLFPVILRFLSHKERKKGYLPWKSDGLTLFALVLFSEK